MIIFDRQQISSMIPHSGTMCLLDAVLDWDSVSVHCLSYCHHRADNPLRRADGTLSAISGVEIAAQAMAVHARLVGGGGFLKAHGYLVSVRDVRLRIAELDGIRGELIIDAECLMGDTRGATYRFLLKGDGLDFLDGRATVLFRAPE